MFKTQFQIDFFNKWKWSLIKSGDFIDTLYSTTVLECNSTYIHTHTHINISQYHQHSKKFDNIDKTVPVSFLQVIVWINWSLKRRSTLPVCWNTMACYFRGPQHLPAPTSVISLSVYCLSFLSSVKDGASTRHRGNIFPSSTPHLFEARSWRHFSLLHWKLLGTKAAQKFNHRPRASS